VVLLSAHLLIFELVEGLRHQRNGFQLFLFRNPPDDRNIIAIQKESSDESA
jgi:hypothetical protein